MIRQILTSIVAVIVAVQLIRQVRKPNRGVGRFFVWMMNHTHSALTDWGLQHVTVERDFQILDVGCGGGRTIQKLAAIATEGKVYGIDYAKGSVAASRGKNRLLIENGRVEVQEASVSKLPFPNDSFDLVIAVETQYYWPDLVGDMKEVLRVLKPGGKLVVIAESYKGGKFDSVQQPIMTMLKSSHLSAGEHRELFSKAGYVDVQIFEQQKKGWFCGTGRKA